MASTKYNYQKVCNIPRLTSEIQDSSVIAIAIDYINVESTYTDIWMKDELPSAQETELDTIVSNHENTPLPDNTPPTKSDGTPIYAPTWRDLDGYVKRKQSKRFTITAGQTNNCDWILNINDGDLRAPKGDIKLVGGSYFIQNPSDVHEDDIIQVQILLPNDTIYREFGIDDYVMTGCESMQYSENFGGDETTASEIPESYGMKLRVIYDSNGATNLKLVAKLYYYG